MSAARTTAAGWGWRPDGAGTNADVAAYIPIAGPTRDALDARFPTKTEVANAGYVPAWKPNTAYTLGQTVINPNGDPVTATSNFTSGATYSANNWTASAQNGRIVSLETTLNSATVPGILGGFVGSDDRMTALMLGLDGDLTEYSAGRIGRSLGVYDAELESGQDFAVVDDYDRIIFSNVTLGGNESPYPTTNWAHWGDSMTDDAVTGVDAWVNKLSVLTGQSHYNGGWYQQTADQIAARQGGLPALVTVSGNVTASSGATTITSIVNKPVLASGTRYVHGTLAGIPGIIQEPTSGNVQFTPDASGAYPIPANSVFIPTNGLNYRDRVATIWSGRNNVPLSTDPILVVAAIRSMIDYLSPNVKRVMVMEVVPAEFDDSTMRTYTATLNAAIKAAFPEFWLDIASWLRTTAAATAAGITFDTDDNTDIANGNTPGSFRSDSTHLNATGCTAVAYRVHLEAQRRGWLV